MSPAESKVKLPRRSIKFGVGKEIGGNVYLHRDFESVIGNELESAKRSLPTDFGYTVVKLNLNTHAITFTQSPDFDTVHEPIVGKQLLVREDGSISMRKPPLDPYIYHHKWLFVDDAYQGFDVEESKTRSSEWMALPDVDRSLIGRASYWNREVVPRLNQITTESWLRSEEVRKRFGWTTCELAHQRDAGNIPFKKVGNAFLYRIDDENASK
ncbi:hypothetical protein Mal15_65000 [Stieleria maiorica]|uniref:Uncharacterized protein n=1 Tax=Stieleria maiorica TaxID=2795974 RepID=A0A5B9MLZ9_9BACT|nr:hypothetical protein [Stieleria maiorica]QEG02379.1 hypothetical protein Mal15_65000 [Stieleria maiorica]